MQKPSRLRLLWVGIGFLIAIPCAFAEREGDLEYSTMDSGVTITGYTGKGGAVTIPDKIAGLSVDRIGDFAFKKATSLTSVTIPDSVTKLAPSAFAGCSGMSRVSLGKGVSHIGESVFRDCKALIEITMPASLTSIGNNAFWGCKGLTKLVIPNNVSTIWSGAFHECSGLVSVTMSGHLKSIRSFAFADCHRLNSITIPASVTEIEVFAFKGCVGLTHATFEGNAPASFGLLVDSPAEPSKVFAETSPNFTIHYYKGATGFTTPEWNGYKTVELDPATTPIDWISADGKTLTAKFVKLSGESVVVEKEDGKQFTLPFAKLSPASIERAKALGKLATAAD